MKMAAEINHTLSVLGIPLVERLCQRPFKDSHSGLCNEVTGHFCLHSHAAHCISATLY